MMILAKGKQLITILWLHILVQCHPLIAELEDLLERTPTIFANFEPVRAVEPNMKPSIHFDLDSV